MASRPRARRGQRRGHSGRDHLVFSTSKGGRWWSRPPTRNQRCSPAPADGKRLTALGPTKSSDSMGVYIEHGYNASDEVSYANGLGSDRRPRLASVFPDRCRVQKLSRVVIVTGSFTTLCAAMMSTPAGLSQALRERSQPDRGARRTQRLSRPASDLPSASRIARSGACGSAVRTASYHLLDAEAPAGSGHSALGSPRPRPPPVRRSRAL